MARYIGGDTVDENGWLLGTPAAVCGRCDGEIYGPYYDVAGDVFCEACMDGRYRTAEEDTECWMCGKTIPADAVYYDCGDPPYSENPMCEACIREAYRVP